MKYLLHTEVLIDPLMQTRETPIEAWMQAHATAGLAISALAMIDIQAALAALAPGADRNALTRWLLQLEEHFEDATLPFDAAAARPCARLLARGAACGAPVPLAEAMLAGIAEAYGLIIVARPTPHLALWGGPVVDPWIR